MLKYPKCDLIKFTWGDFLLEGICPEGILSWGDFVQGDIVLEPGRKEKIFRVYYRSSTFFTITGGKLQINQSTVSLLSGAWARKPSPPPLEQAKCQDH